VTWSKILSSDVLTVIGISNLTYCIAKNVRGDSVRYPTVCICCVLVTMLVTHACSGHARQHVAKFVVLTTLMFLQFFERSRDFPPVKGCLSCPLPNSTSGYSLFSHFGKIESIPYPQEKTVAAGEGDHITGRCWRMAQKQRLVLLVSRRSLAAAA